MKKSIFIFLGVIMPFFLFSQEDTTVYEEVIIHGIHPKFEQKSKLDSKEIQHLAPSDLGTALQYINGLVIKNYGDVGGMKTLSHRGMGGEHTQLIIDNKPVSNVASGQINFANIPPNNIASVRIQERAQNELLPVSALVKGNAVIVETFDQSFEGEKLGARVNLGIGSFGLKETFVSAKHAAKKYFVSASGGYKDYLGDYPYRLSIGNMDTISSRRNNAMSEYQVNIGAGLRWKGTREGGHFLKANFSHYAIDQELAGAVILYNNAIHTTMDTRNTRVGLDYTWIHKGVLKAFLQYSDYYLRYFDPDYLNSAGFLENKYATQTLDVGFHWAQDFSIFTLHLGDDFSYDQLTSSKDLGAPLRCTNTGMVKLKANLKFLELEASGFVQSFIDKNSVVNHQREYHQFHPQFGIYTAERWIRNFQFYAWYRPSSRAPSFNELYYSQIGNKELEEEEASQFNAGMNFSFFSSRKLRLSGQANFFRNKVRNKILALPTKNLFIWSIQNIGKVDVLGGDLTLRMEYDFLKDWSVHLQASSSYQRTLDVTDEKSPSYQHQIAYVPLLTGNALFQLSYKEVALHLSGLYIGERFSLNENVKSNYLEPYFVTDLSLSYSLLLKEKHRLSIQGGIKNLADIQYNYIRYFVMPGRNYFLKLSYAFN